MRVNNIQFIRVHVASINLISSTTYTRGHILRIARVQAPRAASPHPPSALTLSQPQSRIHTPNVCVSAFPRYPSVVGQECASRVVVLCAIHLPFKVHDEIFSQFKFQICLIAMCVCACVGSGRLHRLFTLSWSLRDRIWIGPFAARTW